MTSGAAIVDVARRRRRRVPRPAFPCAASVVRSGETLLDGAWGWADRTRRLRNTPSSAFQIASISKQFTAAAILLLQEDGLISVDDAVNRWLSRPQPTWRDVTVHHLLSHTSGLPHWEQLAEVSLFEPRERAELIDAFAARPLARPPGARWSYSSPGYVLLADVIEQISGEPYGTHLRRAIFDPLGMRATSAGNASAVPGGQATGYSGQRAVLSFELDTVGIGAGDIWSTTADMRRWNDALMGDHLLGGASREVMFAAHAAVPAQYSNTQRMAYGYGWFTGIVDGRRMIFHTGGNSGFSAINAWFPDEDTSIVVLSNDGNAEARSFAMALREQARD